MPFYSETKHSLIDKFLFCLLIFFATISVVAFFYGYSIFQSYAQLHITNLPLFEQQEFVKNKITFLFSIMTASGLLATVIYNIRQFNLLQNQIAIQEFEKKFYNRLEYLDKTIIPQMIYEYRDKIILVGNKRDTFRIFNKHFGIYLTENQIELPSVENIVEWSALFQKFYYDIGNGNYVFGFYIKTFEIIVKYIHFHKLLSYAQKLNYFEILFSQLNQQQIFTMEMIIVFSGIYNYDVVSGEYSLLNRIINQYYKKSLYNLDSTEIISNFCREEKLNENYK